MANNQNVCCVPAVLNYSKLHNKKRSADHSVLLRKKKAPAFADLRKSALILPFLISFTYTNIVTILVENL